MNTLRFSSLKATRAAVVIFAAAALTACAVSPTVVSAAPELAPAGKLGVGLLTTNPAFVSKDGTPEEMQGVGATLPQAGALRGN